jgi:hypothetical protein
MANTLGSTGIGEVLGESSARTQEKVDPTSGEKRYPARRWVVERILGWLS